MKERNKKIIASAKKRILNYQIEEKFIAGLVLNGYEVKSLRNYQSSIDEAYISFQKEELYITKMHISPYKHSYESKLLGSSLLKKKRKLLLQKKEIKRLIYKLKTKNYLLVPLLLFFNQKGWAKLEIGLVLPLRKYQIKAKIKEKEIKKKLQKRDFDGI